MRKDRGRGTRREPTFGSRNSSPVPLPDEDDHEDQATHRTPSQRRRRSAKRTQRSRRPSLLGRLVKWGLILCFWGAIGLGGIIAYQASQLPPIDQLSVPKRPPNIAILSEDGVLLANRGDTGGAAIRIDELPPYLPKAFVAIEDRRFYSHWGLDPVGIARAVFRNVTGRGVMQGGSTLTQQLAKNLFLTQERTMSRKIQEAILAIWLERKYSKDQILELYLNRVYFGSGAYGVEAGARTYFKKSARAVTLAEAAILAGLMKAPTRLAPNRNPTGAAERGAQVIDAMAKEGFITPAMAQLAISHPAEAVRDTGAGSINYAADYVMDVLDETLGAIDGDIVVITTLNTNLQNTAEKALTDELDKKGAKYAVTQGALVSMDPSGAIKALVGGRDYAASQFNRATTAHRQPGSSFKPFVYLTALEKGLTPDTIREDAPINIKGWQPENSSKTYFGPVTLTNALAMSLNTVAVRLGVEVGAKNVARTAHRLGIVSDLQANASIALGTSEVTPLELVSAYVPFANGGIGIQPHIISRVKNADGKLLYQRKGTSNGRVIDATTVSMMNTMMQETLLTGTARKAELPGWQAAGKTGTSQDYRDAWFVGYTSNLITGVWLGNDDNSPTKKTSGGNLPVEIWSRYMKVAHQNVPVAALPGGVWRDSGGLANAEALLAPAQALAPGLPVRDPATGQSAIQTGPLPSQGQPVSPNFFNAQPGAASRLPPPVNIGSPPPVAANVPVARAPSIRRDGQNDLLPPGLIPGGSAQRNPPPQPPQEKNLFEKLFGG